MSAFLPFQPVSYTLQRSRRRTVAIHVEDGRVEVRAPLRLARRDIEEFVHEKMPWILRRLDESRERAAQRLAVADGESLTVLGQPLTVSWQVGRRRCVEREGERLCLVAPALDSALAQRLFLQWLATEASAQLLPRADARIAAMGLQQRHGGYTLRYTRSLWGRCNARGNILFNPLILMAPLAVIDYLIVHEAAHLRHMDHSPAFWSLVAAHCQDWQSSRRWLRQHGHRLRVA